MVHGAPRMFSPPTRPQDKTSTSTSRATKVSFPPLILKRGNNICIKQVSTARVQLVVVKLKVKANGRSFITYGLFDPGSELSLMRVLLCEPWNFIHLWRRCWWESCMETNESQSRKRISRSRHSTIVFPLLRMSSRRLKRLTYIPEPLNGQRKKTNYPHLADLDLIPIDFSKITIFLKADCQDALKELQIRKSTPDSPGPWGIKTVFGWWVRDSLLQKTGHSMSPCFNLFQTQQSRVELNEIVHNLWSLESFGILPDVKLPISKDNARALRFLEENIRCVNRRYEAPLLWSNDHPDFPDYVIALSRFTNLDKSLKKSVQQKQQPTNNPSKTTSLRSTQENPTKTNLG